MYAWFFLTFYFHEQTRYNQHVDRSAAAHTCTAIITPVGTSTDHDCQSDETSGTLNAYWSHGPWVRVRVDCDGHEASIQNVCRRKLELIFLISCKSNQIGSKVEA